MSYVVPAATTTAAAGGATLTVREQVL